MKLKSRPEKVSVQGSWVWGVRGRMAPGFQQSELPEPRGHSSTPGSPFLHPKKRIKIPTYIIGGLSKFAFLNYPMCNACGSKN